MKSILFFMFGTLVLLAACDASAPVAQNRADRLKVQISVFQSSPEIVDFLATEAARAGVRSIKAVPAGGIPINGRKMFVQYGLTTSDKKIFLNNNNAGGRSVVNITHEIAHVAAFGGRCRGHNRRWLNKYLEIADRFEDRFPGKTWSGTTPTKRVMRNENRYKIGSGACR